MAEREIVPLELREDVTVAEEHAVAVLRADTVVVLDTVVVIDAVEVTDVETQAVVVEDPVKVSLVVGVKEADEVAEELAV